MNRYEVARLWSLGIEAKNSTESFRTDGIWLYSYNLVIGVNAFGKTILYEYTARTGNYWSMTTSCHVGIARHYADIVVDPDIVEEVRNEIRRKAYDETARARMEAIAVAMLGMIGVHGIEGKTKDFEEIIEEANDEEKAKVAIILFEKFRHLSGLIVEAIPSLKAAILVAFL